MEMEKQENSAIVDVIKWVKRNKKPFDIKISHNIKDNKSKDHINKYNSKTNSNNFKSNQHQ